jgi:hypothetical protein
MHRVAQALQLTQAQVQNFNIGQRSPLFDKFQPKYALAVAAAARTCNSRPGTSNWRT